VERHSRFVALVKVPSKDTTAVVAALGRQVRKLPTSLRRSLTWDRGMEMAQHKSFTVATDVKVYFCDPARVGERRCGFAFPQVHRVVERRRSVPDAGKQPRL